jgi:hypothetical protein
MGSMESSGGMQVTCWAGGSVLVSGGWVGGEITCSAFAHLRVLSSLSKRPASCTYRSVVKNETRITNL